MRYLSRQPSGDPSSEQQQFNAINLQVWCCRYWKLDMWDCNDMLYPYWRIYWNKNSGGVLQYHGISYEMNPQTIYLIAPFTPFHTSFVNNSYYTRGIHVQGKPVVETDNEEVLAQQHLLHFFIHFNLGVPIGNIRPGVFTIAMDETKSSALELLLDEVKQHHVKFSMTANFKLYAFITMMLSALDASVWDTIKVDSRILNVLQYIDRCTMPEDEKIKINFQNSTLAEIAAMAQNSFTRLFRQEMGVAPQHYIRQRRIAQACALFDHTGKSIDEVAEILGFADRYHFSRVFRMIAGVSPARYRKAGIVES